SERVEEADDEEDQRREGQEEQPAQIFPEDDGADVAVRLDDQRLVLEEEIDAEERRAGDEREEEPGLVRGTDVRLPRRGGRD
ncbi:MAG TPA: hypothetical protein VN605_11110, partial [Thermoanaerobaculia bacterium]|nr:hypothetical protein [Thermoanaerobaculia bacterium]